MSAVAFLVSLEDRISPAANASAASLAQLDASLKKDSASLKTMEGALKRLQSTTGASAERVDGLKAAIDAKKASIAETTNEIADYSDATAGAGDSTGALSEQIAAMGGPIGIAIAVVLALGAAVVALGAALVSTALASASQYRSTLIMNEALSGSAEAGAAMTEATYRVARGSALASDSVQKLATELGKAGLSGSTFERSLKNLSDVASVVGEEAVKPIEEIIAKSQQLGTFQIGATELKKTGLQVSAVYEQLSKDLGISIADVESQLKAGKISSEAGIDALNKAMESKFGALAGRKLLDFDTQIGKAKEGFAGMFRDVNIEPFLEALSSVTSMLDESTTTGKALKSVLGGAVQGFFDIAAATMPYVKEFLLQIGIAALKLYIAVKPAIKAIKEFFADSPDESHALAMDAIGTAAKVVVGIFAGVLIASVIALAAAGAVLYGAYDMVAGVFVTVGSAAHSVYTAINEAFTAAVDYLMGLDFGAIATDLVNGLVNGIKNGTGLVIAAISSLGSSAVGALKATLGIASPSKVFAGLGGDTASGFAVGLEDSASMVAASVSALVEVPYLSAPDITANDNDTAAAPSAGGNTLTIGSITINVGAGKDQSDAAAVEEALGIALRDAAERMGFALAPVPRAA